MTQLKTKRWNTVLSFFLLISLQVYSEETKTIIGYANELAQEQESDVAYFEYRRALFMDPTLRNDSSFVDRLFSASLNRGKPLNTLNELNRFQKFDLNKECSCVAKIYEGRAYYSLENYPMSKKSFDALGKTCDDPWMSLAAYRAGLARLRLSEWKEASNSFSMVRSSSSVGVKSIWAAQEALKGKDLRLKSSGKASLFNALLPGAGYAYAGAPKTAIAAFITNGLFIWGTASAAHKGESGVAAVLGIFSVGWYFGGIFGGAVAAEKYNYDSHDKFVNLFEID